MGTTILLALIKVIISTVFGILFAWILARTDLPGRNWLEVVLWLYYFLPLIPVTMSWILLLAPDHGLINQLYQTLSSTDGNLFNIYSLGGIVWVSSFMGISVRVLMIAPAFRLMDASLEESAIMSGASPFTTLWKVTVPLLLPSIMGATILGFIRSMEAFEVELLLGVPARIFVYTTRIYELVGFAPTRYPPAMAYTTFFLLIVFALIYLNKRILGKRQYTTVSGKSFSVRPVALGRWKMPLLGFVIAYIAISTILPLSVLVLGTFMRYFGLFSGDWFTIANWREVVLFPGFMRTIGNTLMLGVSSALIGVVLYTLISYIVVRTKLPGRGILDFISWLPWSVPGIVLALGLLWAFVGGIKLPFQLYGTLAIMTLAIIIKTLPFGVRLMNGNMIQIHKELEEASLVCGASWSNTFKRIMAPLLAGPILTLFTVVFLTAIRDVVTIVLLYSAKTKVLSTLVLEYWVGGRPEKGMVVALIQVALVLMMAVALRLIGGRQSLPHQ